ncbi:MAG TPA: ABC transporter permease [Thermomicrobiales bacterium]|nr:ABC transporter permease [Thermomicrobiales bacterium]
MASLTWRAAPIVTQTVRQFAGGRTIRVVWALSLLPCIFAAIYLVRPGDETPASFLTGMYRDLVVPTLLPIAVLLLATAAFGNELDDRTLLYLTLKPVSRLRIVCGKLIGTLLVALPAVLVGLVATALVASVGSALTGAGGDWGDVQPVLLAMLGSAAASTALIASIFLAVSLFVPRALLAGIVYIFLWESLLGRFLPGIQNLSIRHYTLSIFAGLTNSPLAAFNGATPLRDALITVAVVCAVAIAVATLRLRSMQLA